MHASHLLALAGLSHAVDIQLFFDSPTGDATNCMGDNRVQCLGIPEQECCPIPSYMSADSALFDGLNTGEGYGGLPAFGVVFNVESDTDNCGTSCNSGTGSNLCLSCPDQGIVGANWYQPRPARKRDGSMGVTRSGDGKCKRSVEPSLASIGDAHFNIGRAAGVPEEHTKQFYALLARGVTLEGVPEHLLVYRNETYVPASV